MNNLEQAAICSGCEIVRGACVNCGTKIQDVYGMRCPGQKMSQIPGLIGVCAPGHEANLRKERSEILKEAGKKWTDEPSESFDAESR